MTNKKNKRDVLLLCQFFYPDHNSSATLPHDTALALSRSGLTVDVLCGWPKEYTKAANILVRETAGGVRIHRLRYFQPSRTSRFGRLINFFSFTARVLLHIREIGAHRMIMVYSNPPILPVAAVMANKLFGTRIMFVAYDVYPEIALQMGSIRAGSLIDRIMRRINQSVFSKASRVIALTEEMKNRLTELRPQIEADRIVPIANWAHERTAECTPDSYAYLEFEPGDFIVSYFGNMGICQEMNTLVDAMELLKDDPNIHFLLAGHGSKMGEIKNRTKNLPNVRILEFLTDDLFEQALSISSCCIVTLMPGLKGLCAPSKYYSYLQAGKPVVSVSDMDSYLAKEIEKERIGYAVSIGEKSELASHIQTMKADPDVCAAMGARARALYLQHYGKTLGTEAYVLQCQQVLKEEVST